MAEVVGKIQAKFMEKMFLIMAEKNSCKMKETCRPVYTYLVRPVISTDIFCRLNSYSYVSHPILVNLQGI
jgi:hypothetical protein